MIEWVRDQSCCTCYAPATAFVSESLDDTHRVGVWSCTSCAARIDAAFRAASHRLVSPVRPAIPSVQLSQEQNAHGLS
jgi:hypothetical protein